MSIQRPQQEMAGTTLDLVGSLINHSCDPNAFAFFENSELRVRSLKPIYPGDEITQTYVDFKAGVMVRQEVLQSEYFFTCKCKFIMGLQSLRRINYSTL
jgi:SET and MYND domain-containing protein